MQRNSSIRKEKELIHRSGPKIPDKKSSVGVFRTINNNNDNKDYINNQLLKNHPRQIPATEKSAPKILTTHNSKSTEKKVIHSFVNNNSTKNYLKAKK